MLCVFFFFFQAEDGIRDVAVTGVQTCALPISGIADAVALARQADVAVVVLGEGGYMSGEAASRSALDLPGVQQQLLEAVQATGTPIVLVLMSGRPLAVPWAAEHVHTIVLPGFLGRA